MGNRFTMKRKNKPTAPARRGRKVPFADPFHVPKEDKHSRLHTFSSDIDQQESLLKLKSEVAALSEDIKTIKSRVKKLEDA